jgi:DNA-binding ferritin-like protein
VEKTLKIANLYVATLRSLYLTLVWCHWTCRKNAGFYGDHLLFERLYGKVQENADLAAEKFIGLFGANALDYTMQTELIAKVSAKYSSLSAKPFEMALKAEKDFLQLSQEAYNAFEAEKVMTLGVDDMVMSIASDQETACYLLQQSMAGLASKG